MAKRLIGLFEADTPVEKIAEVVGSAIDDALKGSTMGVDDHGADEAFEGDDALEGDDEPTRLDPGVKDPSKDPNGAEQLRQAQNDRLLQMAVYGLTEEDFGDEVIWSPDED